MMKPGQIRNYMYKLTPQAAAIERAKVWRRCHDSTTHVGTHQRVLCLLVTL
jgi:hypothetical protein